MEGTAKNGDPFQRGYFMDSELLFVVAGELVDEIAALILEIGHAFLHIALELIELAFGFGLLVIGSLTDFFLGLAYEVVLFGIKMVCHLWDSIASTSLAEANVAFCRW